MKRRAIPILVLFLFITITQTGCSSRDSGLEEAATIPISTSTVVLPEAPVGVFLTSEEGETLMTQEPISTESNFLLFSTAFQNRQKIPAKYTCDGVNVSPQLQWTGAPSGTKTFALIVDDPDAPGGVFTHWVLFNLPADRFELPEGISGTAELKPNHGTTGWRKTAYGGPCPPSGTHHYIFTLYASDAALNLSAGASKKEVLAALEGHVLATTELIGLYSRQ